MEALFGKRHTKLRTNPDAVELALDLTVEAITLYERASRGGWKKFASVQLDDPEFPIVIGLLRSEAEAHAGGPRPVRLWLPGEQVLKQRARIEDGPPAARLRAAFDYVDRNTVYRPEDVAVAVAPTSRNGETTLLITFADTWREARDYTARWGFIPGEVSTRHHVGDFGADGPVFQLNSQPPEPSASPSTLMRRNRLAVVALALAVVAAGAAAWSLRPWETPSGLPETLPGTTVEVAEAPAATPPPGPESPEAAPLTAPEPATRVEALPPEHSPDTPLLTPPGDTDRPPETATAPEALRTLASPDALAAPAAMAAAPLPPPDPEPAPPERDPVAAWTGPVPALEPPGLSSLPAVQEISGVMESPPRVEGASRLAESASPPQAPVAAPTAEPPPAEPATPAVDASRPVEVAEASLPAPIPVPRPTRTDPNGGGVGAVAEQQPPKAVPPPLPAESNQPETETTLAALAPDGAAAATPAEVENPDAPTKFASLTSPLPKIRPALPAMPRDLPSAAKLPAITGAAQRSIRAAATEQGLPLGHTALIGILNLDTGRKALLRLPNGRYRTVIVGDVLDGWRVSMIGIDAMRITRSGADRTFLLVNR